MKIQDLILDWVIDTSLFEPAFQRKHAIDTAGNLSWQLDYHLVKIKMYGNSQYFDHWCDEVNNRVRQIQRHKLTTSRNPLDEVILLKTIWEGYLGEIDDVQDIMNECCNEHPTLPVFQPDAAVIHKNLFMILKSVCRDISQEKFKDIRNYI